MKKQIHYNIDNINKTNANYYLIYGEKSNGKSYQVKYKEMVEHYLATGMRFILLRRWDSDLSSLWIESYFADVDVAKLTKNKYNCISCYRKILYFSIYDQEKNKIQRIEKIGYVMALNTEQHMSSASFLDVDRIVFEEFMERGGVYIKDEPSRLMIFYSTIDRKRGITKLYLVGNSISRVCPYISDWNLTKTFRNLKQGEIATIDIQNEENKVRIAIEYCLASGGKTMAIGSSATMIDKGGWQTKKQPKLEKSKKKYKCVFRFFFYYKDFKFICEYLKDMDEPNKKCFFIYPKYTEFKKEKDLVFTDKVIIGKYFQRNIYNPDIKNSRLKEVLSRFTDGNIFYSDDLTGTDFKSAIDFEIRK